MICSSFESRVICRLSQIEIVFDIFSTLKNELKNGNGNGYCN